MTSILKGIENATAIGTACVVSSVICTVSVPVAALIGVKNVVCGFSKGFKEMYEEKKRKESYTVNWINVD
jgi:hypothetical protein